MQWKPASLAQTTLVRIEEQDVKWPAEQPA